MFASLAVTAAARVSVLGLFNNKAVVLIDGRQRTLALNQTSPEGVTLISINSDGAVLEIGGKRSVYPLGGQAGTSIGTPKQTAVQVYRDPQGMYMAAGSINGFPVNFLVDTGATAVAMNSIQAKRMGINFRLNGESIMVNTASGVEQAYQVKLARVKLGDIELYNIDAVVLDGPSPSDVLLGMSFLGRLEIQNSGQVMQLKRKY
jgi:aspartyl protease family protein